MLASHWVYPEFECFANPKTQITRHAQSACWQTGLRRLRNLTAKHRTCSTAFCRESKPPQLSPKKRKTTKFLNFLQLIPTVLSVSSAGFVLYRSITQKEKAEKVVLVLTQTHSVNFLHLFLIISSRLIHASFSPYSAEQGNGVRKAVRPAQEQWGDGVIKVAASHSASKTESLPLQSCPCCPSPVFTQHLLSEDMYCV